MTLQAGLGEVVGSAYVTVAGAAITNTYSQGYVSTITRTGAGVFTIALNAAGNGTATAGGGLSPVEYDFLAQVYGTAAIIQSVNIDSTTQVTLRTFSDAAVATDPTAFSIVVLRSRRLNN